MDNVLLRLALDTGIFNIIIKSTNPTTLAILATETRKADYAFLRRLCRALCAIHAIKEAGVEAYAPTNFTRAFTTLKGIHGARFS